MQKTFLMIPVVLFCSCVWATTVDNDCDGLVFPDPPDALGPTITGARVLNQTGGTIELQAYLADNDCDSVMPGFQMVDTTMLKITSNVSGGRLVAAVRKAYDAARLRASGIRPADARLMIRVEKGGKRLWRSCADFLRQNGVSPKRKEGSATFVLGDYGVDVVNNYVWAVMPTVGDFAVGVPEPLSLGLMAAGGVLVIFTRRR